ncbi:hypothetical protein L2X99_09365 [Microbacterium sp. KUDC0406]|uniref:hypothetical protein n=1 Tax=Microbacterium sp. KUDC0406 TaxID=2909588 RepID=UPI001F21492C|nr:hypothetical protein [Microbacterium sp. KUDC0406]UJP08730.1 hypothetical protein L2X99_09365 [Microbacterium sp. KUDC0406]
MSQRAEDGAVTERGSSRLAWASVGLAAVSMTVAFLDAWDVIELYLWGDSLALLDVRPAGRMGVVVVVLSLIASITAIYTRRTLQGGRPAIWAIILSAAAFSLELLVPLIMQLLLILFPIGYALYRLWTA